MRTFIFFIISSFVLTGNLFGQDLNKYKYVQVPEKFDFLKEENKYQLNALTAFLLEKYGFEAFYEEQIPAHVNLCDVLQANVHNKSGLFRSKVYLTLEDCNDRVVFTSQVGASREKDFQKSYHEALREAFTSLEGLRKNPEVIIEPVPENKVAVKEDKPAEVIVDPVPVPAQSESVNPEVVIDPVITSEEMQAVAEEETTAKPATSGSEMSVEFVNGAVTYFLKETAVGYELYREGENEKYGTLLMSGRGENYLYSSKSLSGNAFFDTQGNLIVEYIDPKTQQVVSVVYKRRDQ